MIRRIWPVFLVKCNPLFIPLNGGELIKRIHDTQMFIESCHTGSIQQRSLKYLMLQIMAETILKLWRDFSRIPSLQFQKRFCNFNDDRIMRIIQLLELYTTLHTYKATWRTREISWHAPHKRISTRFAAPIDVACAVTICSSTSWWCRMCSENMHRLCCMCGGNMQLHTRKQ